MSFWITAVVIWAALGVLFVAAWARIRSVERRHEQLGELELAMLKVTAQARHMASARVPWLQAAHRRLHAGRRRTTTGGPGARLVHLKRWARRVHERKILLVAGLAAAPLVRRFWKTIRAS